MYVNVINAFCGIIFRELFGVEAVFIKETNFMDITNWLIDVVIIMDIILVGWNTLAKWQII